jgi:hypothetical protein
MEIVDYLAAMDTPSSPIGPPRKRARGDNDDPNSDDDRSVNDEPSGDAGNPPLSVTIPIDPVLLRSDQNLASFARRCATKRKLRLEQ